MRAIWRSYCTHSCKSDKRRSPPHLHTEFFMKLLRAVALLFVVTIAVELFAQTGSIGGVVTDPSGAVVGEAKITATNKSTNLSRTTTSSASGIYSIPNLDPGPYS